MGQSNVKNSHFHNLILGYILPSSSSRGNGAVVVLVQVHFRVGIKDNCHFKNRRVACERVEAQVYGICP